MSQLNLEVWPLSRTQMEILQFELEEDQSEGVNNICELFSLQEGIAVSEITSALNQLIRQEQALRLQVCKRGKDYGQYACDWKMQAFPELHCEENDEKSLMNLCKKLAEEPFRVLDQPLYRFYILHTEKHLSVIFMLHHLIADGYSMGLLGTYVEQFLAGQEQADTTEHRYTDYVVQENRKKTTDRYLRDEGYWRELLHGYQETAMICPEKGKLCEEPEGARISRDLTGHEVQQILKFCKDKAISPAAVFLAALVAFLWKRNPKLQRIDIGQMTMNRKTMADKATVGNYAAELLTCVSVNQEDTWDMLLAEVISANRQAFYHSMLFHDDLLEIVREKKPEAQKIRDLEFGYLPPVYHDGRTYPGVWIANEAPETTVECNLFHMTDTDNMRILWDYRTAVLTRQESEHAVEEILTYMKNCMEYPKRKIVEEEFAR